MLAARGYKRKCQGVAYNVNIALFTQILEETLCSMITAGVYKWNCSGCIYVNITLLLRGRNLGEAIRSALAAVVFKWKCSTCGHIYIYISMYIYIYMYTYIYM